MFETIIKHTEKQNNETIELQLQLQDAKSQMKEMNHKTSIDVARLLEEERTNAETDRHNFLNQIGALYDLSFQQRWDRLQGNYGIVCDDISSSDYLMDGLAAHSRVDEWKTKQKQFAENLDHLKNQLKMRMNQDKNVWLLILFLTWPFDNREQTFNEQQHSARQAVVSASKDLQQTVDTCEEGVREQAELWAQNLENMQSYNDQLNDAYLHDLNKLETSVHQSYSMVKEQLETGLESWGQFQKDILLHSDSMVQPISALENDICEPLSILQASIKNPLFAIDSLKRLSDCTNATPHHDGSASSITLVHDGPQENDFCDRKELIDNDRGGISPSNSVHQPCLKATAEDSEQPRPKRRRTWEDMHLTTFI